MVCATVLAVAELIQYNLMISQPQGRFIAHVLPAMAIVFVTGLLAAYFLAKRLLLRLWPQAHLERWLSTGTMTFAASTLLVGLNLGALFLVVVPAYAGP
jgi:hypothetical protein